MTGFRSAAAVVMPVSIALTLPLLAQVVKSTGPKPAFEVASVRPNTAGDQNSSIRVQPGGRLTATNQTVQNLIRNAWNLQPNQMIGGPGWFESDRFDIVAKVADADLPPDGRLPPDQMMLRMQALLEERFKLVTHWETRQLPVYSLVLASTDGKPGPNLKAHTGPCADRSRVGGPPQPAAATATCGTRANMSRGVGKVTGTGITLETFARNLSGATGRNVVDATGLAGAFDLELEFTMDQSPDSTVPSLFTAVQEQLGLKLDSQRAPVEVLVIDSVERPTPD